MPTMSLLLGTAYMPPKLQIVNVNAAPVLGSSGASTFPAAGWVQLRDGSADDSNVTASMPFSWKINNTNYSSLFVGSNSYITFGGGSNNYSGLSASNPGFSKIFFGAADNSYQRVSYISNSNYIKVRYEGNGTTSGTVGSPGIVVEVTLVNPEITASSISLAEVRVGVHNRLTGLFGIASPSAFYAQGTIAANTSYVFQGDSTGTSYTLLSNHSLSGLT
jgi:hypothetical protein